MFSTVTSAFFSIDLTISRPRGDFRSIVSDFLLALNWWKYQGSLSGAPGPASRRPGSPTLGFSILTTSAPSQASDSVQDGPASNCVKSTILTPSRQSSSTPNSAMLSSRATAYSLVRLITTATGRLLQRDVRQPSPITPVAKTATRQRGVLKPPRSGSSPRERGHQVAREPAEVVARALAAQQHVIDPDPVQRVELECDLV